MSVPHEHDSEASSVEKTSESSDLSSKTDTNTELRLGLPGFDQDLEQNHCKNSPIKNFLSGAKRGFCDVSGKWGFNGGSNDNLGSSSRVLFGVNGGLESKQTQQSVSPTVEEKKAPPDAKAQVVGWPPIRSFRKNTMAVNLLKNEGVSECGGCLYVKVSMDGAPYLRKVDLKTCNNYLDLSKALEKMFSCFTLGQCTSSGLKGQEGLSESNLKDILRTNECVLTYEDKDGDWMLVGDVPWEMFIDSCKRLRIMKGSEAIGLAPRSMEKGKRQIRGI